MLRYQISELKFGLPDKTSPEDMASHGTHWTHYAAFRGEDSNPTDATPYEHGNAMVAAVLGSHGWFSKTLTFL